MSSTVGTIVASCLAAGVLITIPKLYNIFKNKRRLSKLAHLQDAQWNKVGSVKELYTYPIMYGRENDINECLFEEKGLSVENEQGARVRDKMFVIYDEETKCVQSCRNFTIMLRLKITTPSKGMICFKDDNQSFILNLKHNVLKKHDIVECKVWNYPNETLYYLECLDCGVEAAEWISNICLGKDYGLRLGYYENKTLKVVTLWESFGGLREVKETMRRTIKYEMETSKEMPIYTMITEESLAEVNQSLLKDKSAYDFNANFVISIDKPLSECQYEYFKIGKDVIIANVKPWKRPRINPSSIPTDLKLKLMPINCKVLNPGKVKLNDDVYVRITSTDM